MTQEHHDHNPLTAAIEQQVGQILGQNIGHIVHRAVGASLAAASGALRESSYGFNTIDPSKMLTQPHPMDVSGLPEAGSFPDDTAVVLHNRLIYRPGSYMLIISYGETAPELIVTNVVEEALHLSTQPDIADCIKQEISRQVAQIPPKHPGQIRLVGVTLQPGYFTPEQVQAAADLRTDAAAAGVAEEPAVVQKAGAIPLPASKPLAEEPVNPLVPKVTDVTKIATLKASAASHSAPDVQISPLPAPVQEATAAPAAIPRPRLTGLPPAKR